MRWRAGCGNLRHRVKRQETLGLDAYTVAGFVGVACIVTAYFANQQESLNSEDWRFRQPTSWVRC